MHFCQLLKFSHLWEFFHSDCPPNPVDVEPFQGWVSSNLPSLSQAMLIPRNAPTSPSPRSNSFSRSLISLLMRSPFELKKRKCWPKKGFSTPEHHPSYCSEVKCLQWVLHTCRKGRATLCIVESCQVLSILIQTWEMLAQNLLWCGKIDLWLFFPMFGPIQIAPRLSRLSRLSRHSRHSSHFSHLKIDKD